MMNFGRIESLMYACRINLYWTDDDGFVDLREAKVVKIVDNEITLYDGNLYWSYDIDVLEAKLDALTEQHCNDLRNSFAKLRAEGAI